MKSTQIPTRWLLPGALLLALSTSAFLPTASEVPFRLPLLWPEEQRAFLQDGPGLLLSRAQLDELLARDVVGREEYIVRYLAADPDPATPENELAEGIARRRALVLDEIGTFLDDRAKLLFLHGEPQQRRLVDCAETFRPLEVWSYDDPAVTPDPKDPAGVGRRHLVLYEPGTGEPYRLWKPIDAKRVLYNPEMEYWLEQWEELRDRIRGGRRFDREICKQSKWIDEVTGISGLFGFLEDRPRNADITAYLQPPDDLAAWARSAQESPEQEVLPEPEVDFYFTQLAGHRLVTQIMIRLPAEVELEPFVDEEYRELRIGVEGSLERDGEIFETFRMRFQMLPSEEPAPVALLVERRLRPNQEFLARIKVVDEIGGSELRVNRGFAVPLRPMPPDQLLPEPKEADYAVGQEIQKRGIEGYDSLHLVPPETDVVFGLWRAEALVTGRRIEKVVFLLDDQQIMSRRRPPFSAELRLATYPTEQVVRVEGYDDAGELVAFDQVILNQPRGELQVRILEPLRGRPAEGDVKAKVEVVVPEEHSVTRVTFTVNEELEATVEKPPWESTITVPPGEEMSYLTVVAELENGARAEDVRFLNAPRYLEEVEVNLVELFTTVTDGSGRLVTGLEAEDFQVMEDGQAQTIAKFELVEDLPLTLGIAIDTSGSMYQSLSEAERAAVGFLENIITPKDRCFALAFSDRPVLLMPRTSDVGAVEEQLEGLIANGATSLHDAIVTGLYYYRGIRGRRAMVLLSDGEDTSSTLEFSESLEYARRSGVAIFTIGLGAGRFDFALRRKLENLAQETGGRTFFIQDAGDLSGVYDEIERELRSQYLVAYNSTRGTGDDTYRQVVVKVKGGKLKARTTRGYYPSS